MMMMKEVTMRPSLSEQKCLK